MVVCEACLSQAANGVQAALPMRDASAGERFEEAARIRDRIEAVEKTLEQQQIVSGRGLDHDVFGLSRQGGEFVIAVLHVREGRVVGTEDFGFSRIQLDEPEVMSSFIGQYYGKRDGRQPPREILSSVGFDDGGSLLKTGIQMMTFLCMVGPFSY